MDNVLSVSNLSLHIDQKHILKNVSFTLAKGETLVIMGKNACGKTMLLKTVFGLFSPQNGESVFWGKNIYDLRGHDLSDLRKKIGYVFQKSGLFDSLTVAQNVVFALQRFTQLDAKELARKATESLNRSGLKDVETKLPSELSGGMQKRAGIARAIAMNPELLLMDDPTAGLDPVLTDAIADLIIEIKSTLGSSAIVITHDLKLAYKLASKIGLMVSGELKVIMGVDEFRNSTDPYVQQFREGRLTGPISVLD